MMTEESSTLKLNDTLAHLRREYTLNGLLESDLDPDPFVQFERWMQQAIEAELMLPNSMALATVDSSDKPAVRIVLLKSIDHSGLVFFTNYESRKGEELAKNPNASVLFHWVELERQVRVEGVVEKTSTAESEEYFRSRPYESQLGAWASHQSGVVPNRAFLEQRFAELSAQYSGRDVPLPPYWGGFRMRPHCFEFWQGRVNRLHDRLRYTKQREDWKIDRLSP